ncbi:sensor histidine kinase [Nonomuraea sp. NPDC050536]|uniref:sensor histidine kinase n=1 Tax=Nonomuraea sp. NPDC050536 TaxID=3364366 RepID=UPI0037CB34ED
MKKPVKKSRSLRTRLTLLVAAAVAIAVAVSAVGCWYLVYRQLSWQLNASLSESVPTPDQVRHIMNDCSPQPRPDPRWRHGPPSHEALQVVFPDGNRCVESSTGMTVSEKAKTATRAPRDFKDFYDGVADDGTPMRVMAANIFPDVSVMIGRPLHELNSSMRNLAILLAGVAAGGVLLAAWAGRVVSRTALRPVGRLTEAVEHIAHTEDLDTRIPVTGDDEIARLSQSFNAMTTSLAGSRDRQRQLVADAGHELRTPLTILRTNIDLLLRSEQTGRQLDLGAKERLLVNVKAQFAELSALVGDLLQLARGDNDHEPHVELALHDVVKAAVGRAELRGARVATDLGAWYVVGNAVSLERAVLNLIDNAAKFSPGGEVEVRLREGVVTVRDHGPGIPEEELPHVFERFWRSPSARGLPGSGLGLAIVAQAVAEAGGAVWLDNAPGGGIVATIKMPGNLTPHSESAKLG